MSVGDRTAAAGGTVLFVGYFILGLVQFLATWTGIEVGLGLPGFVAFFLAIFIGGIPIIGTITGVYGAVVGWGMSLIPALALFFGGLAIIAVIAMASRE